MVQGAGQGQASAFTSRASSQGSNNAPSLLRKAAAHGHGRDGRKQNRGNLARGATCGAKAPGVVWAQRPLGVLVSPPLAVSRSSVTTAAQQPSPECGYQSTVGCPTSSAQGPEPKCYEPPKTCKQHVRQTNQNRILKTLLPKPCCKKTRRCQLPYNKKLATFEDPGMGSGNRHKNRSRCKGPLQKCAKKEVQEELVQLCGAHVC